MKDIGTILIVDDNPNNLQVLRDLLGQEGYKVRPALSGESALRAVENNPPDLILLDVRMPGIDGYETCRRLQARECSKSIPVIFISAMQDTDDMLAGFRAGGVDYVTKPFQAEEVLARVKAHVQLHRLQQHLASMVQERTQALSKSEARYRVLFEDSPIPIMVFDTDDLTVLAVNCAFTRILGYTAQQSIGRILDFLAAPEQHESLRLLASTLSKNSKEQAFTDRLRLCHRDGDIIDTEGVLQRIDYMGHQAQILMLQDVTESRLAQERLQMATKVHQQQLEQTAHFDALTGLPNRALLTERLRQGVDQAQRTGCTMVVGFLDIDTFKKVNETHGRETGDSLLRNVAECLRACLHGGDTLARLGGDEFALVLLGLSSDAELERFLGALQDRLAVPFVCGDKTIKLSASMGVTVYPQDDSDPDTLLRHADQAMVLAKESGKAHWQRFDSEGSRRMRAHQDTVALMRQALAKREFILYYQPKVDLQSYSVIGAEALIRWCHPERGLLAPGAFLPEIENEPFMLELGRWVIDEALDQMSRWHDIGLDISISVNVAAQQLAQSDFMASLGVLLAAHPQSVRNRLELEVLETSGLGDIAKVEDMILACRQLGVGFSLDDFGTGYSSLTYLRRLSADTLKIDQSFVRDMLDDPGDLAIVSGVIGLAVAFQRKVIAEGVETVAHGKALLALGCTMAQGYGIARPMPAQDLPQWLRHWPDAAWSAALRQL
jgi:diguanylate cyclase (GGDEF)-like protein/PAS domain S-box-containing protein